MLEFAMYTVNHVLYRLNLYTFLSMIGSYAHEVKFLNTPLNKCREENQLDATKCFIAASHNFPHPGHIACCSAPNSRPTATKALNTMCENNTSIVSSS